MKGELIAGGQGVFFVTVKNVGGDTSTESMISARLPEGVELANVIIPGDNTCVLTPPPTANSFARIAAEPTCSLRPLKRDEAVTLGFLVNISLSATSGSASVSVGTATSKDVVLPVASDIDSLTAKGADALPAGDESKLSIAAAAKKGTTGPGPIRFVSTSKAVTLTGSDGCKQQGDASVVCEGTTFTLAVGIAATQEAGRLPVDAYDAGGRSLTLLNDKGVELTVQRPQLLVSDLRLIQTPVGDLAAVVALKVTNPAATKSPRLPIGVLLPKDWALGLVLDSNFNIVCWPAPLGCNLSSIDPEKALTLNFVIVLPSKSSGTVTITVDGVERSIDIGATAPPSTTIPTTDTTDPSTPATTLPSTDPADASAATTVSSESNSSAEITRQSATVVDTVIEQSNESDATSATSTPPATEAANEPAGSSESSSSRTEGNTPLGESTSAGESSSPETTDAQVPPAALSFSDQSITQTLTAGGIGAIRLSVTNTGGQRSQPQPVLIALPGGITASRVTVDGSVGSDGSPQSCTLPEIEPGSTVTVVVELTADATATDGSATVTVDETRADGWLTIEATPAKEPTAAPEVVQQVGRKDEAAPGN